MQRSLLTTKSIIVIKQILLSEKFRTIGWIIFIPACTIGLLVYIYALDISGILAYITNNFAIIGISLGAIFITCSRERDEDEMTACIRLDALLKALYIYVGLIIVSALVLYNFVFLYFMVLNTVLFPLIFMIIFKTSIYKTRKTVYDEK